MRQRPCTQASVGNGSASIRCVISIRSPANARGVVLAAARRSTFTSAPPVKISPSARTSSARTSSPSASSTAAATGPRTSSLAEEVERRVVEHDDAQVAVALEAGA